VQGPLRRRLSYANVTATLALFVALGGTSVAALRIGSPQIADNSIRSVDLRDGQVRSRDVRDGGLLGRDVRDRSLTSRDIRPNSMGSSSVSGLLASDFAPGQLPDPVPATLLPGQTLRGTFSAAVTGGPGDTGVARSPISFGIPLAAEPGVAYLGQGEASSAQCPGSPADPAAAPGVLCLYEAARAGGITVRGTFHPVDGRNFQASRFGVIAFVNGDAGASIRGTWAVTGR